MRRSVVFTAVCVALAACSSTGGGATGPTRSPHPAATRTHHRTSHVPTPAVRTPHTQAARSVPSTTSAPPPPPTTPAPLPPASPSAVPPVAGRPTVVLNPGHNGGDAAHPAEINRLVPSGYGQEKACETTGTNTDAGYPEHAFNWSVANEVAAILHAHGVRVIFTRHSDTGVGPCVNERAAIGNRPGVDAVVSIHADGADPAGHGFHVNQDSRIPDGATRAVARKSDKLGQAIHAALVRSSGLVPSTYIGTDGYFYRTDLAGLNLATRPATFLELGNMRNAGDAALQSSPAGRRRIAGAIAAGILAYLAR